MGVDWKRLGSLCWNAVLTSHQATGDHKGSVSIASIRTPAERLRNQENIFKTLKRSHVVILHQKRQSTKNFYNL